MSKTYTTIDLCAGIGGIRRGFEMTGCFKNVLSAEIDADARRTYEFLYGEKPETDLTTEDFKRKAVAAHFDVLLAGFPCQTFSAVGLKKGFDDPNKGVIFDHIMDILARCTNAHCRPKAFLLENVEYLLAHDGRRTINTILNKIELMRYKVVGAISKEEALDGTIEWQGVRKAFLRNSRNFGVPQNRPRVFIMAFDQDYFGSALDAIADDTTPMNGEGPGWASVNDIIESDTSAVPDKYYLATGYWQTLLRHRRRHADSKAETHNGFGCVVVNDPRKDGGALVANTILATGGAGRECNLIRQFKPDLNTTDLINGKKTPLNKEGIRFMMPDEWGKLQGFIGYAFKNKETGVDEFRFPNGMSDAQKYKQFGNSVTVPVIKSMADFMLRCFDKMEPLVAKREIENFLAKTHRITFAQVCNVIGVPGKIASRVLKEMTCEGALVQRGYRRGTYYTAAKALR